MHDVDKDNLPDFLVGASGAGMVYLVLGRMFQNDASASFSLGTRSSTTIIGFNGEGLFGHSIGILDVNGDTNLDLVIGAPGVNTETGRVSVILGREGGFTESTYDMAEMAGVVTFTGESEWNRAGNSVAYAVPCVLLRQLNYTHSIVPSTYTKPTHVHHMHHRYSI
jgi:hypothetical protein